MHTTVQHDLTKSQNSTFDFGNGASQLTWVRDNDVIAAPRRPLSRLTARQHLDLLGLHVGHG